MTTDDTRIRHIADPKGNHADSTPKTSPSGGDDVKSLRPVRNQRRQWLFFGAGFLWGILVLLVCGVLYLRANLVVVYDSDRTMAELEHDMPAAFDSSESWTIQKMTCALPNASDGSRLVSYQLCNRAYAQAILDSEADRKAGAVLPCAVMLFETPEGKTKMARLNMRLVGMILGGVPGIVLPRDAVPEQEEFFRRAGIKL